MNPSGDTLVRRSVHCISTRNVDEAIRLTIRAREALREAAMALAA